MKAVNLIPAEERRGAGGVAGRSGGAVYVILGALALLVLMMGAYLMTGRQLDDKRAELARSKQQADAAEAKASQLSAYTTFAQLRAKRVETVRSLTASRFDWAFALHEVSRVVPDDAWLTSLVGTVAPGVAVEGGGTSTGSLRSGVQAPAVEISGCTTSQSAVATMMARMRLIDGVQRVGLASSEKTDSTGGGGGAPGGGGGGDCRNGSDRFPKFDLIVFFKPVAAAAAPHAAATASHTHAVAAATGDTGSTGIAKP
jgi:Tfp pilus assembly protein PilN